MPAAAEADRAAAPDARAEERAAAAELEVGAELRELADRHDFLADDRRAGPSETPSAITTRGATTSEPSPRSTSSPIWAPASRSALTLSAEERAERLVVERLEEGGIEHASGDVERRRQRDALGRDAGSTGPPPASPRLLRGDDRLDVLLGDEPALLDRGEVDRVQLASSTAFRVALRSPAACRGRLLLRPRVDRRELVGRLGDVRDRLAELDLDLLAVELHDRPGAGDSTSTVAFVVSTTQTG